jgi:Protein of unknwon function (DUF3310).
METIDIVKVMTEGVEGLEAFCLGNATKYLSRYNDKNNAVEDLKKAIWYINKIIGMKEKEA